LGSIASASGSILAISVMSALADVVDEHELNTGVRQEGVFYAARTFFSKTSNGIGHVIAGLALDFIEFPTNAVPGEIAHETIFKLGLIDGPFAMVWGLIAVFFYARYKITKESHATIKEKLAIKNAI
jgi:Na+/melibiose symporter-like transporter